MIDRNKLMTYSGCSSIEDLILALFERGLVFDEHIGRVEYLQKGALGVLIFGFVGDFFGMRHGWTKRSGRNERRLRDKFLPAT